MARTVEEAAEKFLERDRRNEFIERAAIRLLPTFVFRGAVMPKGREEACKEAVEWAAELYDVLERFKRD